MHTASRWSLRTAVVVAVALVASSLASVQFPTPAEADINSVTVPHVKPVTINDGNANGTLLAQLDQHTSAPFSMVGISWEQTTPGARPTVQIQTRRSNAWSDWRHLELGDYGLTGKGSTDVVFIGSSFDGIAARIIANPGETVGEATITLIDSDRLGQSKPSTHTTNQTQPHGAVAMSGDAPPTATPAFSGPGQPGGIITRAGWGADESIVNGSCFSSYATMEGAVVHHTAGTNSYTAAQSAGIVRGIFMYHTVTLDWCDIGYNFLVDKYGQIFEGRRGSIDGLPHGAHAFWANAHSVGISLMGNSDSWAPSQYVYERTADVLAWKFTQFQKSPNTPADYWDYFNNRWVSLPAIVGHRQVSSTGCPGANIWANMDNIRNRVTQKINSSQVNMDAFSPVVKEGGAIAFSGSAPLKAAGWWANTEIRDSLGNVTLQSNVRVGSNGRFTFSKWFPTRGIYGIRFSSNGATSEWFTVYVVGINLNPIPQPVQLGTKATLSGHIDPTIPLPVGVLARQKTSAGTTSLEAETLADGYFSFTFDDVTVGPAEVSATLKLANGWLDSTVQSFSRSHLLEITAPSNEARMGATEPYTLSGKLTPALAGTRVMLDVQANRHPMAINAATATVGSDGSWSVCIDNPQYYHDVLGWRARAIIQNVEYVTPTTVIYFPDAQPLPTATIAPTQR